MEDNAQSIIDEQDELVADALCFAELFERLSPDAKAVVLELLRQLNGVS